MYEINGETILTFINDRNIKFPRFQRKQTWKDEQNLKLTISLFKIYPIGVVILNKETKDTKPTRWLLDGRQRRNALKLILSNPENIYDWAKKFLKLKNTDQDQQIDDKFWRKMEEYINDSDDEKFNFARERAIADGEIEFDFEGKTYKTSILNSEDLGSDNNSTKEENNYEESQEDINFFEQNIYNRNIWGNLNELLFIIKTVHSKSSTKSGFTKPFDFSAIITNLTYIDCDGIFSGQKITTLLQDYLKDLENKGESSSSKVTFEQFLLTRYSLTKENIKKIQLLIAKNWEYIDKSIRVVEIIENRLNEAKIGIIETKDISATDSQMIFTLINKEGTKLSAVEILSAKPNWNIIVKNPNSDLVSHRKALYDSIGTPYSDTVRWDYPATIYERLENLTFLFPLLSYNKVNELNTKLTLGFKILSGILQKGIRKEDVEKLASNKDIIWENDIDNLINDLNLMGKVLSDVPYFKYLKSWNQNFLSITSDSVALNFLFTLYFDFIRKNKPAGINTQGKIFANNATILADKLVFEYINLKWRGSSDSKISMNILQFNSLPDKFEIISDTNWLKLLKGINDNFKIEDNNISFGISKTLVYHIYSIHQKQGVNDSKIQVDIDHILPQNLFETSSIPNSENIKNGLFNLCPLPMKDNVKKTKKILNNIQDQWLIDQIVKYSGIEQKDFIKYSTILEWIELRKKRRDFFEKEFIEKRKIITNI